MRRSGGSCRSRSTKYPGARDGPQKLYRRTVEYYRHVLGSDPAYNGVTFRNAIVAGLHPEDWIVEFEEGPGCAVSLSPLWELRRTRKARKGPKKRVAGRPESVLEVARPGGKACDRLRADKRGRECGRRAQGAVSGRFWGISGKLRAVESPLTR